MNKPMDDKEAISPKQGRSRQEIEGGLSGWNDGEAGVEMRQLQNQYLMAEVMLDVRDLLSNALHPKEGLRLDATSPFVHARKIMIETFQRDDDLWRTYRDNLAMLMHDRWNITDKDDRDQCAADIMKLLFDVEH